MATFHAPTIRPEDYDAFRRVLDHHLPDTYDEWLYLSSKEATEHRGRGHVVNNTEIHVEEFIRYCNFANARPNLQALRNFAFEKATRQNH